MPVFGYGQNSESRAFPYGTRSLPSDKCKSPIYEPVGENTDVRGLLLGHWNYGKFLCSDGTARFTTDSGMTLTENSVTHFSINGGTTCPVKYEIEGKNVTIRYGDCNPQLKRKGQKPNSRKSDTDRSFSFYFLDRCTIRPLRLRYKHPYMTNTNCKWPE